MEKERITVSASLVSQEKKRFYTLTMDADILSRTCFVSAREEDVEEGFQRHLDYKRAQEIADYIDNERGVIPNSIVLSAQESADFSYNSKRRSVSFLDIPKAFLVLDG